MEAILNTIKISKSFSILNEPNDLFVKDVNLLIFKNNQLFNVNFIDSLGYFVLNYQSASGPLSGDTFEIVASAPNFKTVSAKTHIPEKVLIENFKIIPVVDFNEENFPFSEVELQFSDNIATENFYEIVLTRAGNIYDFKEFFKLFTKDLSVLSESYYPRSVRFDLKAPVRLLFNDKLFNGKLKTFRFNYYPPFVRGLGGPQIPFHSISVQLRNVTKEYYLYYTSALQNRNNQTEDLLFGIPEPINVYSNISQGLGIFSGFNLDLKQVFIPEILLDL